MKSTILKWPPPGLERTQGDLWRIAASAALAGVFLVLPLLFIAGRGRGFATFGPFADAWWVTLGLATVGLAFSLDALARASTTLRRVGRARARGYGLDTIAQVLADSGRDMGFLLSGSRHFSVIDERERRAIVAIRIAAAILVTASGLWVNLGLGVGLFLAARGVLSPGQLVLFVLGPSFVGYVCGGVAMLVQDSRARRARRVWFNQPWSQDLALEEIASWHEDAPGGATLSEPSDAAGRPFGWAAAGMGLFAIVVVTPVLTLAPASAVAPILTTVSAPNFDSYRPRAAAAEAYRSYTSDGDVSVTPAEAGQLLHDLMFVGVDDSPGPGERAPVVVFGEPWFADPDDEGGPLFLPRHLWGDSLITRVDRGLSEEQLAYLDAIVDHPASDLFSRLASATALDVGSARWVTPFPPGTTVATVPVPRFGAFRRAADVHVARAAHAFEQGRVDEAETLLREVVTVGFLLADEGPTLIDNLIGVTIVESGGAALASLYRASGQVEASAELSRLRLVAERAASRLPSSFDTSPEGFVNALPGLVLDSTGVRGFRWEYFINLATIAPCMNVHRMVFGPGEEYTAFIEAARTALVRYPSEEAFFEMARYGWLGGDVAGRSIVARPLAAVFMDDGENSCAAMVERIELGGGL